MSKNRKGTPFSILSVLRDVLLTTGSGNIICHEVALQFEHIGNHISNSPCHFNISFISRSVSGDVVLITGSGNGIGRQMALQFAQLKAKVALWDVDQVKALLELVGASTVNRLFHH